MEGAAVRSLYSPVPCASVRQNSLQTKPTQLVFRESLVTACSISPAPGGAFNSPFASPQVSSCSAAINKLAQFSSQSSARRFQLAAFNPHPSRTEFGSLLSAKAYTPLASIRSSFTSSETLSEVVASISKPSSAAASISKPSSAAASISKPESGAGNLAFNLAKSLIRAGSTKAAAQYSTMNSLRFRPVPSKGLYVSTPTSWLESRFHFSFAEHYDPSNMNFGVLRVLNDDLVQPQSGFGRHPHRNMEILTYVVEGKLTHKDSMGTEETLGRGSVQYMSAGTGVTHSEMNNSNDLLRFLQIWIMPDANGYKPNYGSRTFSKGDRHNKLQQVVTSYDRYEAKEDTGSGLIPIHQDVSMFVSEMDGGSNQSLPLGKGRQAYTVCIEGAVDVHSGSDTSKGSYSLSARDAIEVVNAGKEEKPFTLTAKGESGAHVLIIEMAAKDN